MKTDSYDVHLMCSNKYDLVGSELKTSVTKEEATKFIEDFMRRVIKSYCKSYYCLSVVERDGIYDHNYVVGLTKDVKVYIAVDYDDEYDDHDLF